MWRGDQEFSLACAARLGRAFAQFAAEKPAFLIGELRRMTLCVAVELLRQKNWPSQVLIACRPAEHLSLRSGLPRSLQLSVIADFAA